MKEHLKKYKTVYFCGATAVVVAGITALIMRGQSSGMQSVTGKIASQRESRAVLLGGADRPAMESTDSLFLSNHASFRGKIVNNITMNTTKEGRGHPGFITRNVETGQLFSTQGDAARAFDIPQPMMSAHLNGRINNVDGYHFERLGIIAG